MLQMCHILVWLTLGKLLLLCLALLLTSLVLGRQWDGAAQAPAWCAHGCLAWTVGCRVGAGQKQICAGGALLHCWVSGLSPAMLGWACLPGNAGAVAADAPVSFVSPF